MVAARGRRRVGALLMARYDFDGEPFIVVILFFCCYCYSAVIWVRQIRFSPAACQAPKCMQAFNFFLYVCVSVDAWQRCEKFDRQLKLQAQRI